MSNTYDRLNAANPADIDVCKECGSLIMWYSTKKGKVMPVTLTGDCYYHRHGYNNNYVDCHVCDAPIEEGRHFDLSKTRGEELNKYPNTLFKCAIVEVLDNFNKPRIRSAFKKDIYQQTVNHMESENNQYKYPFSKKVACIVLGLPY